MGISINQKVNYFLIDLQSVSPDQFDVVVLARELFFTQEPHLVEEIKYGGLLFSLSKKSVGRIFTYKEHISIGFTNGSELTDTDKY